MQEARNSGLIKLSLELYFMDWFSKVFKKPPASSSIIWPAAISHSEVGPNLGYKSAFPLAISQNFNELPLCSIW